MPGNRAISSSGPARHWTGGDWVRPAAVAKSIRSSAGDILGEYSAGVRSAATADKQQEM
jgi:hypothetical protein